MSDGLSKDDISTLVDDYLRADKFGARKKYDPVDDFARFMFLARELPGACEDPELSTGEQPNKQGGKITLAEFLDIVVDILYAVNPSLSKEDWRALYATVLVRRHGGTRVRLRKRPALQATHDATVGRMTPKQLQEKHPHLCRSRIYKLIKEAREKK